MQTNSVSSTSILDLLLGQANPAGQALLPGKAGAAETDSLRQIFAGLLGRESTKAANFAGQITNEAAQAVKNSQAVDHQTADPAWDHVLGMTSAMTKEPPSQDALLQDISEFIETTRELLDALPQEERQSLTKDLQEIFALLTNGQAGTDTAAASDGDLAVINQLLLGKAPAEEVDNLVKTLDRVLAKLDALRAENIDPTAPRLTADVIKDIKAGLLQLNETPAAAQDAVLNHVKTMNAPMVMNGGIGIITPRQKYDLVLDGDASYNLPPEIVGAVNGENTETAEGDVLVSAPKAEEAIAKAGAGEKAIPGLANPKLPEETIQKIYDKFAALKERMNDAGHGKQISLDGDSFTVTKAGHDNMPQARIEWNTALYMQETKMAGQDLIMVEKGMTKTTAPSVPDQVKFQIQQNLATGMEKITIQLDPIELGKVEVELSMGKDEHRIAITAEKKETLDLLQRDARDLIKSLQDVGVKADNRNMEFNLKQQNQFTHQSPQQQMQQDAQSRFHENLTKNGTDHALLTGDEIAAMVNEVTPPPSYRNTLGYMDIQA